MNYSKSVNLNYSAEKVWAVVSKSEFQKNLISQVSPLKLDLPDSFYEGKQHVGRVIYRSKTYEYTAKLKESDDSRLRIDIFTDSVDGLIEIKVNEQGAEDCIVEMNVDVEASGLLGMFIGSAKRYIDQYVNKAIRLLESWLD